MFSRHSLIAGLSAALLVVSGGVAGAATTTLVNGFASAPETVRHDASGSRKLDGLVITFDAVLDGWAGDFSFRPGTVFGSTVPWRLVYDPNFIFQARGHLDESLPVAVTATYERLVYDSTALTLSFEEDVSPNVPPASIPTLYPGTFVPLVVDGAACGAGAGASLYDFAQSLAADCLTIGGGTLLNSDARWLSTTQVSASGLTVTTAAVPLPGGIWLGASALLCFGVIRRFSATDLPARASRGCQTG